MWKELLVYYSDEPTWNVCPDDTFVYKNIILLKCYLVTRWLLTRSMTVAPYLKSASPFWMSNCCGYYYQKPRFDVGYKIVCVLRQQPIYLIGVLPYGKQLQDKYPVFCSEQARIQDCDAIVRSFNALFIKTINKYSHTDEIWALIKRLRK
ncbi:hypothetical protein CDAR_526481 [Caerostris darwini]|uniref:Uncharacterized protein n=1 Tax=Caerostris darwini TaxID=1538125 RepID=A0AAV4T3Q2_9ARAC|nr:hypothetical protein CDAR_526481 [Caerostris darwini]